MQRSTRAAPAEPAVESHTPVDQQSPAEATASNGASPTSAALAPPERPRLANGVILAGQTRESAFVDPPWLIDRHGEGYVLVTELLYRIAEAVDGRRTLGEIAEHVSHATGRRVSADNVRQLLVTPIRSQGAG